MSDQGGLTKDQLKKRYLPLVAQQIQKGATPESIIPRLVRAGFTTDEAMEIVNTAIAGAGVNVSPPSQAPASPMPPRQTPMSAMAPGQVRPAAAPVVASSASTLPNDSSIYAGFLSKLVALIIDFIVLFVIFMPIAILMGAQVALSGKPPDPSKSTFMHMVGFIIGLLYFAFLEGGSRHATFGKRALGLMVVDTEGNGITMMRAGLRYLVSNISGIILLLGYLMSIFMPKNQTLHDLICGTVVIKIR